MAKEGRVRQRHRSEGPQPCPCPRADCLVPTLKTREKNGHAVGCIGSCCTAGNRGRETERRRHGRLTQAAFPTDEFPWSYPIKVTTQDKTGAQVPVLFWQTIAGAFFRHAFKQVYDKIPVGAGVLPAVYVEHEDGRAYLVVDVTGRSWK